MAAEAHAPTASEYIVHHLQHLQNIKQKSIIDFSVFNLDSIAVSVTLGALCLFVLWLAAARRLPAFPVVSRLRWKCWSKWWTTRPRPIFTTLNLASSSLLWH